MQDYDEFADMMMSIRNKRWGKSCDNYIKKFKFDYYGAHYNQSYKKNGKALYNMYVGVLQASGL